MMGESERCFASLTWQPIETAPKPMWSSWSDDREPTPVLIWDEFNKRRWLARWDDDSGYFFGLKCIDEPNKDPDRLYGATLWMPVPMPPIQEKIGG